MQDPDADGAFHFFHDFASLNEALDDDSLTVEAFVALDAKHPTAAENVFPIAREALIKAKNYEVCGKYLKPDRDWLLAAQMYQFGKEHETDTCPEIYAHEQKVFTNEVTTLLALLVANGRIGEAERIAQKARLELDDSDFLAAIDSALAGVMPDQEP
jgi:hypothetical protein